MPGGLIQLAKRGLEDDYYTSPANFTLFRGVFKKMSNFAIETMPLTFKQDVTMGATCSCTIDKMGDLVTSILVEVTMTKQAGDFTAAYHPVEALLEDITLEIDGDVVDRHTSDWLRIYNTLHRPFDKAQQYNRLTNYDPETISSGQEATQTFMVPLVFSFCRHPSGALPLVAMQFSEVLLHFKLADPAKVGLTTENFDFKVYADYVYLDTEERYRMVDRPYDCLIEQVHTQTFTLPPNVPSAYNVSNFNAKLNFFHPTKCLYWFVREEMANGSHGRYVGDSTTIPLAYTADVATPSGLCLVSPISDSLMPMYESRVAFNDHDRVPKMKSTYFNRVLPFQYCMGQPVPGVCILPFGFHLEQFNPAGMCNFSNLSQARIDVSFKRDAPLTEAATPTSARNIAPLNTMVVIAWGYNILRIEGGRGTVLFR